MCGHLQFNNNGCVPESLLPASRQCVCACGCMLARVCLYVWVGGWVGEKVRGGGGVGVGVCLCACVCVRVQMCMCIHVCATV